MLLPMSEPRLPLRTGWEPETPVTDTVLRQFVFNFAASMQLHVQAMGGRAHKSDDVLAVDLGRPAGFLNSAVLLRPLIPEHLDDLLEAVQRFYGQNGTGQFLLWSAWHTPDLSPFGWELDGHPPLLILPPGGTKRSLPTGLTIEKVRDHATLQEWEETIVKGYPLSELEPYVPGKLVDQRVLGDDRISFWVGYVDSRAVCAGAAVMESGITDITMIVTLPEARGRGFGTAMTQHAALAEPGQISALLSSDDGRSVYERIGFIPITRFTLWHHPRP